MSKLSETLIAEMTPMREESPQHDRTQDNHFSGLIG